MAQYWLRDQARHVSGWDMIEFGIQPSVAGFKFFVHLSSDRIWKVHLAGLPGPQTLPWGAQWQVWGVAVCVCVCMRLYLPVLFSCYILIVFCASGHWVLSWQFHACSGARSGILRNFRGCRKIKRQCFTWQFGQKEFERRWRCHHWIYNVARPSTSTSSQILLDAPRKRNSASPGLSLALLFKSWNHNFRTRHEPVQMTRLIHLDWAEACCFSLLAFLAWFIVFFQHSTTMHSVFEPLSECLIHSFGEHQIEINTILFPCAHGSKFPDTSPVKISRCCGWPAKLARHHGENGAGHAFWPGGKGWQREQDDPGLDLGNRSWGCQPQLERCFQGIRIG